MDPDHIGRPVNVAYSWSNVTKLPAGEEGKVFYLSFSSCSSLLSLFHTKERELYEMLQCLPRPGLGWWEPSSAWRCLWPSRLPSAWPVLTSPPEGLTRGSFPCSLHRRLRSCFLYCRCCYYYRQHLLYTTTKIQKKHASAKPAASSCPVKGGLVVCDLMQPMHPEASSRAADFNVLARHFASAPASFLPGLGGLVEAREHADAGWFEPASQPACLPASLPFTPPS